VVIFNINFELFTFNVFMVERILSGRFCLLTAPFPLRRTTAHAPLRSSQFSARSASFSARLTFSASHCVSGLSVQQFCDHAPSDCLWSLMADKCAHTHTDVTEKSRLNLESTVIALVAIKFKRGCKHSKIILHSQRVYKAHFNFSAILLTLYEWILNISLSVIDKIFLCTAVI